MMRSRVFSISIFGAVGACLVALAPSVEGAQAPRRPAFKFEPSVAKSLVRRPPNTKSSNLPAKKQPTEDGASGRPGRDPGGKPPRNPDGSSRPPKNDQTGKPPGKRPPIVVLPPPVIVEVPPPPPRTRVPRPPVVVDVPPPKSEQPSPPRVRPPSPPAVVTLPPQPPRRPPMIIPLAPITPPPLAPPPVSPVAQVMPAFLPDEVLITVATAALPQLETDLALAFNVTILERTPLPLIDARLVRLRIPDGRAVPQVVALLASDPRVVAAQPNYLYRHNNDPTPRFEPAAAAAASAPAGLQYALAKLGAADIHRVALGRGARIAVLDSGVDDTHPDFANADIAHFDATDDPRASAAEYDTHGTGIAGIISGRGTVQGLAPGASLASARVFRKGVYGSSATTAFVIKGITWSVETGARILNMSFAGPRDSLVERHLQVTTARGMIAVAAAGNFGATAAPAYPAAYEGVIAVTAIDANDRIYDRANQGSYIAVAAPGVDVIVPAVGRAHHFQSGTSFAAAHVSGVAALLLELDASLSPAALRDILVTSADDLGAVGPDTAFGAGRINVARSAARAQGAASRP